jgi:Na+-translocating ferredoxin:NAD+ oxidoreductase RnfG subunit
VSGQGRYLETTDYLATVFPDGEPVPSTLWVTNEIREAAEDALDHEIASLRVRYWQRDQRTAWIFDEIGKDRPITIGVVVEDDAASMVRVLEFRETRGWEVRYPFFTDQFDDARLNAQDEVDQQIDGITGATLSVAAVTRVVRLALFLYRYRGDSVG